MFAFRLMKKKMKKEKKKTLVVKDAHGEILGIYLPTDERLELELKTMCCYPRREWNESR